MNIEKKKSIELLKADLLAHFKESSAPTYQPLYFSELRDVKTSLNAEHFYKKFKIIFKYIDADLTNKSVIDVGANAGFFSFAVAERNAIVDALEPANRYHELCKKLTEIYDVANVNCINAPLSLELINNKKYDYGFMLSVFQWISEGNNKLSYALNLLNEISKHVDVLFFELGCNAGKSAVTTKKFNHLAYVYSLLKNNTIYKNIKLIGTTSIWRRRPRYLFMCSHEDINAREPWYAFLKRMSI